jgi:hypothetical protein
MQGRPERAGSLVGDPAQPPSVQLVLVRDAAVLAQIPLAPPA